jgi:hypothetical protein
MILQNNELLYPDSIYEIPHNLINGYYLFASESASMHEARLHTYETYPPKSWHTCWQGHFGCAHVRHPNKYIRLEKGTAVYYGEKPFELYEVLNAANFNDECFHQSGITVMDNIVCRIKVMQRKKKPQLYHGDCTIEIFDQYVFSINDHICWGGIIENHSFKSYNNVIIALYDDINQKECVFEKSEFNDGTFSVEHNPVRVLRVSKHDFFTIMLPNDIENGKFSISWLQPNSSKMKCFPFYMSIDEVYKEKYERLAEVILEYNNLGLELDTKKEFEKFSKAPDLAEYCIGFLSEQITKYSYFLRKKLDKNKRFTFHVGASYDKKYYCAAKLADLSVDIKINQNRTVYYVTFDGTQIEEIDLMYYNLASLFNTNKEYMVEISTYLKENLFFANLQASINSYIGDLEDQFGYSSVVRNSILISIIKSINKNKRRKLNKLYSDMTKENRVNVKWSSEYKLFDLISKYVNDAIYQYRAVWLGQQSFDIFLPSNNIAIEYQGLQHFEAVEVFGGQDALERNIYRDDKKRKISSEHGIIVLDWKYDLPINVDNVFSFLQENKISFTSRNGVSVNNNTAGVPIDMAPIRIIGLCKKNGTNSSQFFIKQYSTNGDFIADHSSYEEASRAAAVSKQQVQNAIRGSAKTAGGYQWRKLLYEDANNYDLPIEPIRIDSTAKAVYQISSDGKVIAAHESIKKASKSIGVSSNGIRRVLNGTRKTSGGFFWAYKKTIE